MATEQILLSSSSFDGMRETGGFGQPLHTLYPQIRAVLAGQLGAEVADLLAEPVVDRARGRIDWYAEGDPDRSPMALNDLPEEQRQPILARIEEILGRGRELAERYAASGDVQRMQLGAILKAALGGAVETGVFLVEGRPVMTGWGFAPDRPWEMPAVLAQPTRSLSPASDAVAPRDVAIPDIALPELATAPPTEPEPAPPPESPPPFPEARGESSLESVPEPPPGVATDAASPALNPEAPPQPDLPPPSPEPSSPPAFTPIPGVVSETAGEPLFKPDAEPIRGAAERPAMAEAAPASPLRYVVVGSRYFWSVFALAIVLALGVAGWVWMKKPAPYPVADQPATSALAQAQHAETALRARLESLLTQLAERRGQCRLPDGSASVAPAIREPGDSRPSIPTQSTVAVTGGDRPPAAKAPVPGLAEVPVAETPAAVPGGDRTTALPAQIAVPDRAAIPETTIPTDRATGSLAASGRNSGDMPSGVAPAAPDRMTPGDAIPAAPDLATASPDTAAAPSTATSRTPSGAEAPAPSLEDLLVDRSPPSASLRQPSPMAPPVRAEPTVEERREFTNRLSAAGAATGEITVALLWNSPGDLDLVVRCPSGRRLDYQHTVECGGTLDVDANAVRDRLSDRPVENAFWPAGKAEPGSYEIAVRYAPRKDEQNPAETSFQVRLVRGGQESVFKGAIRPNATVPVTTFTVER